MAVIHKPVKGLFDVADKKFRKDAKYRNNAEVTDEIWFLLHYKKVCPSIQNIAEKENVLKMLQKRNRWLYQSTLTFTTVQDAMKFLIKICPL